MPRLSDTQYLATRLALRDADAWLHRLDLDDLLVVHRFFAPTKPFTDDEALAHRQVVTANDPSLPHRSGKILRKQPVETTALEKEVARATDTAWAEPITIRRPGHEQRIVVRGVRRPEVDLRKLVRLIEQDMRKPVGERLIDKLPGRGRDEAA